MPVRLTVVGSINVDLVARCERLPEPGETLPASAFEYVPGGKGANQAVAARRLGAVVRMNGCVGSDRLDRLALELLRGVGVDLGPVLHVGADTGLALIVVADDGETQIVTVAGANAHLGPDDLDLVDGEAVLCQLEIPLETVVALATRATGFLAINAAPARALPPEVLRRADVVVANRYEADVLAEEPRLLALTMGPEGALLREGGEEIARAEPPPVDAVDGTAAGDAFTACLVVSLLEGRPHEEALRRACAAGAVAASRFGAQPSLPTAGEVDAILARA